MSLILSVPDPSLTTNLLAADTDEPSTESESCSRFAAEPPHSRSPTGSPLSYQKPIHVVSTEPLDPCYHEILTLQSEPSPYLLKPDYPELERKRSYLHDVSRKISRYPKDLGRAVFANRHNELKNTMIDFGETTTAHGIPMILNTDRVSLRIFWIIFSTISLICFCFQCYLVVDKFQKKEKIVNVELEFESAPFPAITICNLNPFKKHLARSVPEISETLDAFHQAVTYSNDANNEEIRERKKRNSKLGELLCFYPLLLLV
ncbi:hypothetical protein ANCCAN_22891 [Ancylostoma caninum]|uniref:Amiloride-sensitive sodium channel n=1 Tax=Ancylostoma caninum TaxID=29170 RepID=A0A368FIF5_ANCCA|nr:hypothetical protein ANCCAN_22891 [Ancylostoma caninum]